MSTTRVIYPEVRSDRLAGAIRRGAVARFAVPLRLAGGLLLLTLYAAFEHGAVGSAPEARLQIAIAGVTALSLTAWLWTGTLRLSAPRFALMGVGLLIAFVVWCGISLAWSVAPDHTWTEVNRGLTYVIVLCLAIAIGASLERAIDVIGTGFLLVALAVAVYALGQKIVPGLHVSGVFDLNRTGPLSRLQEPLGYWNALALFVALAVPTALALAVDVARPRRSRLAALCAVELMLLVIGFTYSRGAVLALILALVIGAALSGAGLRTLMWLGLAVVATVPPLVFGLVDHSLTTTGIRLTRRELAGAELGVITILSLAGLAAGGAWLAGLEARVPLTARRAQIAKRWLVTASGALAVGALLALALSSRGLDGTVSHAWKSFTTTREASISEPSRLLSADSANRWVWWKEAAGAFSDRPIAGWGAGSFGVVHLLYRRDTISVAQPHSVPLQFLAETGLVGAALGVGAFLALLAAGLAAVRRLHTGSDRLLAAGLLAGSVAYSVHALYDWDWDIPALTLPVMLFLGVLAGTSRARRETEIAPSREPGAGFRAIAIAIGTLGLCAFALSAALPSLAASKASRALVTAAGSPPASLRHAQSAAVVASSLDPLSDAGLRVQATIAVRRGQLAQARRDLLAALGREPTDAQVWESLAFIDFSLGDAADGTRAITRELELDPKGLESGALAATLAQRATLLAAPPGDSATAAPTPSP